MVDAIEGITHSDWSHCGILLKKDGRWCVAEAIGDVRYTPLHLWLVRGRHSRVTSYRLANPPAGFRDAVAAGVTDLFGLPYDFHYAPGDDEIYCSELVYKVYDRRLGIKIGEWQRLGDLDWKPFEPFLHEMEGRQLPLDRLMITPAGLTLSPLLKKVF